MVVELQIYSLLLSQQKILFCNFLKAFSLLGPMLVPPGKIETNFLDFMGYTYSIVLLP